MKRWITRGGLMLSSALGLGGCKVADLDHCLHRGENAWCEANEPERRFCSPCEPVADHYGCVPEAPTADACPAFESPTTGTVDASTGSSEATSTSGSTAPVDVGTSSDTGTASDAQSHDDGFGAADDRAGSRQRVGERHDDARP